VPLSTYTNPEDLKTAENLNHCLSHFYNLLNSMHFSWLLLSCLATPALAVEIGTPISMLVAPHHENILLDGDFSDWEGIQFISVTPENGVFDGEASKTSDTADLSFRFAVCHDNKALYVAVEVTDDIIITDSTNPKGIHEPAWDDDAIEVFIDGNFNRAPNSRIATGEELKFGGEFSLIANGAATSQFSGYPRSFGKKKYWQGAVKRVDTNTIRYEYRLFWRVMGGKVKVGDTIGFTLAAQDDDDGGRRDHSLYWKAKNLHGWQNESGWGAVYLAKPQSTK
jgi:hypothetical protein